MIFFSSVSRFPFFFWIHGMAQPCPKTCSIQVLLACFVETGVLREKSICITRFHVFDPETHRPLWYSQLPYHLNDLCLTEIVCLGTCSTPSFYDSWYWSKVGEV
jgi:hypothetical protein